MANNCIVEITMNFFNKNQKALVESLIKSKLSKEDKVDIIIGNIDFFDVEIETINEKAMVMRCWVKWNMTDEEVISFVNEMCSVGALEQIEMKLFEPACGICEKYVYTDKAKHQIEHYVLKYEKVCQMIEENKDMYTIWSALDDEGYSIMLF